MPSAVTRDDRTSGAMAKQKARHVPQRTCVACREVQAKAALVRLVRTPEGVLPDSKGKMSGRGAYLHARRSCWDLGIREKLSAALRIELTDADRQRLTDYFSALEAEAQPR